MAPPVVVGVVLGAIVARYSDGAILKAVWIVCAILISLKLFLGAGWDADGLPPGCASHDIIPTVLDSDLFHRREIHHREGAVRAVVPYTTSGPRRPRW